MFNKRSIYWCLFKFFFWDICVEASLWSEHIPPPLFLAEAFGWLVESHLIADLGILILHIKYYITQSDTEPTQWESKMNIGKLRKPQNSSLASDNLWWTSLVSYHLVGHLEWQQLPQITKMTPLARVFHDKRRISSYLHPCKCGTIFCEKYDFLWKNLNHFHRTVPMKNQNLNQ